MKILSILNGRVAFDIDLKFTAKMKNENLLNARNEYRKAHGLLISNDIVAIRENMVYPKCKGSYSGLSIHCQTLRRRAETKCFLPASFC